MTRRITITYAYHPADDAADLELPTSVVNYYQVSQGMVGRRPVDPALVASIKADGVQDPVLIYTDGIFAKLGDGHHRVKIAVEHGVATIPVQVIPDSMKRATQRVVLEPELEAWVTENLWIHETHEVTRRIIGNLQGGTLSNSYTKCECSCNASWKEAR